MEKGDIAFIKKGIYNGRPDYSGNRATKTFIGVWDNDSTVLIVEDSSVPSATVPMVPREDEYIVKRVQGNITRFKRKRNPDDWKFDSEFRVKKSDLEEIVVKKPFLLPGKKIGEMLGETLVIPSGGEWTMDDVVGFNVFNLRKGELTYRFKYTVPDFNTYHPLIEDRVRLLLIAEEIAKYYGGTLREEQSKFFLRGEEDNLDIMGISTVKLLDSFFHTIEFTVKNEDRDELSEKMLEVIKQYSKDVKIVAAPSGIERKEIELLEIQTTAMNIGLNIEELFFKKRGVILGSRYGL